MDDLLNEIRPIFEDILDHPGIQIELSMSAADVEGWDSLAHIRLILRLEQAYGVRFSAEEVAGFLVVRDLVGALHQKIGHA